MPQHFDKNVLIVGYGSIGKAILPVLIKELELAPQQVKIITFDDNADTELTRSLNIVIINEEVTPKNYREIVGSRISKGDILINVSVDISSLDLIDLCQERGTLYLDTCIEPWKGFYYDDALTLSERSNYALREKALELKRKYGSTGVTAVIAHGANPGIVSHFTKQALLNLANEILASPSSTDSESEGSTADVPIAARRAVENFPKPTTQLEWALLAQKLNIESIHIAEFDWQSVNAIRKPNEFFCTWSVDGFISEGLQPAELGWGTHEKSFPADGGLHDGGQGGAIYLNRTSFSTKVRSWTPLAKQFQGHLVTHNEAISIANFLTVPSTSEPTAAFPADALYRPTVHYAYRPINEAIMSVYDMEGNDFAIPVVRRVLVDEVVDGIDELGVLLMGHDKTTYWYGSHLSCSEAREIAPYNNATSMQVVGGIVAALCWMLDNPARGVVEAEELDHEYVLAKAAAYLGPVGGFFSSWTPVRSRAAMVGEKALDTESPFQFDNFRI